MQRVVLFGLGGLLLLGLAGADLMARAASMLVTDVSLASLGTTDHPAVIPTMPEATEGVPAQPVEDVPDITRQDVLLVGTDSRAGLSSDQMSQMGAGDHGGALTDTIIWVQYLPETNDLRMVSIPRDLAVETDDYGVQKINAVHPLYGDDGADHLISEVEELVGADLDHYVEINLAGLVALTDAVGGVEVCLDEAIDDEKVGYIPAGCQTLDGIDAGRFTRARHVADSFGEGAHGRNVRQQYFIRQAIKKILSAGTLTDPTALRGLAAVASDVAVVDDGLTLAGIYELATVFRNTAPDDIEGVNLPVTAYVGDDGLYYERPREPASEAVFEALRYGTALPELDDEGNLVEQDVMAGQGLDDGGDADPAAIGDR